MVEIQELLVWSLELSLVKGFSSDFERRFEIMWVQEWENKEFVY